MDTKAMKFKEQIKRPFRFATHSAFFVREWVQSPRNVGAIAPSSSALGAAMARHIDLSRPGAIIELGGGTGALTRALLKRIPADRLVVFERNPKFAKLLRKHFPSIIVIEADARDIDTVLKKNGIAEINSIVSGIPLRSIPKDIVAGIIKAAFDALSPGASFIQFTYGMRPPVPESLMNTEEFKEQAVAKIWRNLPPATVWKYTRSYLISCMAGAGGSTTKF